MARRDLDSHPVTSDPREGSAAREDRSRSTELLSLIPIYLRGLAMGAADIVPGVSGGTMALILGIYERLIHSLRSLARPPFLKSLLRGRLGYAFEQVDGAFLLALTAGIFTSVLTLAHLLTSLLESSPVLVYAFFFGLVLASVFLVARRIRRVSLSSWVLFALGTVAAFVLVGMSPADTPDAAWFLFLSGAVAISALLLPGISGAFVLVLLGKYSFVLAAVNRGDLVALGAVGAGAVFGLLSFTQLLGWLFRRYHDATLALLCGVMFGSLRKIWPWQTEAGGRQVNFMPATDSWADIFARGDGLAWVVLLAILGAGLVTLLDTVAADSQ